MVLFYYYIHGVPFVIYEEKPQLTWSREYGNTVKKQRKNNETIILQF